MAPPDFLILNIGGQRLAFGLEWHPIIGERADRLVWRLARQRRASHVVVTGPTSASVGLATLHRTDPSRAAQVYSAAQNMARAHGSGTVAMLYRLDNGCYWLVGIHEGAVIVRTDCLYSSPEYARSALDELQKAYPQMRILADCPEVAALLGNQGHYDLSQGPTLASLAALSWPGSLLREANWKSVLRGRRKQGLLLCLLVLTGWSVSGQFQTGMVHGHSLSEADQFQLWEAALEEGTGRVAIHGVHATHRLLQHLYALPLDISGWMLRHVECLPGQSAWQCRALLDRSDPQARNSGLLAGAPAGWTIDFISMERAQPSWQLPFFVQTLTLVRLQTEADNQRHLQSALQAIRPAFTDMQLGLSRVLDIAPPPDESGHPIPRPKGLPVYSSRLVHIRGPLRSASLLLPHLATVRWQKIALSVNETARASLQESQLSLDLSGELYELKSDLAQ